MKRTRLKKVSKQPISKIQRDIWQHCRRIVFDRDSINGEVDCYTCPSRALKGQNCQLGHVPWPKATLSAYLKYDLRLLKYQCFRCNINFSGMGGVAYPKMVAENGQEWMTQMEMQKQMITVKAYDHYVDLLAKYAKM